MPISAQSPDPSSTAPVALPGTLVSAAWLHSHQGDEGIVILDCTVFGDVDAEGRRIWHSARTAFTDAHIPGARFVDQTTELRDASASFDLARPAAGALQSALRSVGVSANSKVVVYDSSGNTWATRVWWLLRQAGHTNVALLDGGIGAWTAEGLALTNAVTEVTDGDFTASDDGGLYVSHDEVVDTVNHAPPSPVAQLVCALPPADFRGELTLRARAGHIPGSQNVPAGWLFDRDTALLRPEAELREQLASVLANHAPVVAYCGSGVSASGIAFALDRLGRGDVRIYDGSMAQWAADDSLPIATGTN